MASNGNQHPLYLLQSVSCVDIPCNCSSLIPANFQSSDEPFIREQGFEISNLQATHFPRPDHAELYGNSCCDFTAVVTLRNEQRTVMEMDNTHLLLPQYSTPAPLIHSGGWPTAPTPHQVCQTFITDTTPSRYPRGLSAAGNRMDTIVQPHPQCVCDASVPSFRIRPETFPVGSTMSEEAPLSDHALRTSAPKLSRNTQLPVLPKESSNVLTRPLLQNIMSNSNPANYLLSDHEAPRDLLGEATWVRAPTQTLNAEHEFQSRLKATNVPNDQVPCGDFEILGNIQGKAKPSGSRAGGSRPILGRGSLTRTRIGSHTIKKVVRPMGPRSEMEPKLPDRSSKVQTRSVYRAARGFAVHPRSIAERVRRSRIAEKIKILESKLPDSIKTASLQGKRKLYIDEMLERAIAYIRWLQNTIQTLLDEEALSDSEEDVESSGNEMKESD